MFKAMSLLASKLTCWTTCCDKALHRLNSYIDSTCDIVLRGWVGDDAATLELTLYADADFAGDRPLMTSTTGGCLALHGERATSPLSAKCKRQTSTIHSTSGVASSLPMTA